MKKRYSIKRTLWFIEELTYEEDGRAKELLKKIEEAFQGEEKTLGVILEKVYDSGVVPDLFTIILKPYQPTFLHALWNAFWARHHHLDRSNIKQLVGVMKNSEIGAVLSDFFFTQHELDQQLGEFQRTIRWEPEVSGEPDESPLSPEELIYLLAKGDFDAGERIRRAPALAVYKWLLLRAKLTPKLPESEQELKDLMEDLHG